MQRTYRYLVPEMAQAVRTGNMNNVTETFRNADLEKGRAVLFAIREGTRSLTTLPEPDMDRLEQVGITLAPNPITFLAFQDGLVEGARQLLTPTGPDNLNMASAAQAFSKVATRVEKWWSSNRDSEPARVLAEVAAPLYAATRPILNMLLDTESDKTVYRQMQTSYNQLDRMARLDRNRPV